MKPKTKLHDRAIEISQKLRLITIKQMNWAFESCLDNNAARSRKTLYCLECGHSWKDEAVLISALVGCTCPNCSRELKLKSGRNESAYFAIITAKDGVQVVRMFWAQKNYYKKSPTYSWTSEVMRHFIFPDGKVVTLSKKVQGLSRYYDQWVHNSELEVRSSESYHAKLRYDLGPYKIYPERTVIPELKRNGFAGHFYDFTPHKFFSLLLSVPAAETLLKARQIGLLQHLTHYPKDIEKYWRSIRICMRNGYIVKDASTWFDHIKMLEYLKKDLHSPHYVCPVNLKSAHDRWLEKKKELKKREKLERIRQEIEEAQIEYEEQKRRFFGLQFKDNKITVKVLEHVREFLEEGEELSHCVFNSEYYKREDALVMSARIEDKPVETIEISLTDIKIIQARGKGNKSTKHHSRILNLVNNNLHEISAIMSN